MRVAIFSDVHGNLAAMEAVLADLQTHRPDYTLFAGDIALFGARPAATIGLMRANPQIWPVYGNTDEWILSPPEVPADADERTRAMRGFQRACALWAREQLAEADLAWLGAMPFAQRLSPTASADDDLLVVHANPQNVHDLIAPTAPEQQKRLGKVAYDQTPEELAGLLLGVEAGVIAFGHLHFPNLRRWQQILLANISSVSNPLDGDRQAKYGLLNWDRKHGWQVEIHRVAYDLEGEQAALSASGSPHLERLVKMLVGA